jgi:predicted nucleotidyltransferase
MTRDDILPTVRSWAEKEPLVLEAYLFGSFARDEAGPESDIDLAIVTDGEGTEDPYTVYFFNRPRWTAALRRITGRRVQLQPLKFVTKVQPAVERDGIQVWP